jgi:DNA-binding NtrC family response regulator
MRHLLGYPWPGNVRELGHAIEIAVALLGSRDVIDLEDLAIAATASPSSPPVSSIGSRPPNRTGHSKPGPRSKYQLNWSDIYEQVHTKGVSLREIWRALPGIEISYPWFCASFSKFVAQYEATE